MPGRYAQTMKLLLRQLEGLSSIWRHMRGTFEEIQHLLGQVIIAQGAHEGHSDAQSPQRSCNIGWGSSRIWRPAIGSTFLLLYQSEKAALQTLMESAFQYAFDVHT